MMTLAEFVALVDRLRRAQRPHETRRFFLSPRDACDVRQIEARVDRVVAELLAAAAAAPAAPTTPADDHGPQGGDDEP